ncbi:MAG TPA: 2-oxo-4-hydroxy-4-carboxy-5-ureidoimidazoline decarboxylase [Actinomycetes bacterium]
MAEERLARFNALPPGEAEAELLACCAAPSWAAAVAAGRPYATIASVLAASDDAFVRMPAADLSAAVAAHPRIGDRATSDTAGPAASSPDTAGRGELTRVSPGHEGEWSRQEQAGVAGASVDTMAALAVGNKAYEERFGQVFLICATGLSAADMLAALRTRLRNDPDTEAKIVREELRKITGLRLRKLLGGDGT